MAKRDGGMRFRGIEDFNLRFLGKHFWRIVDGKNYLLSEVLKYKYYPRCLIQNSNVGFAPNYI